MLRDILRAILTVIIIVATELTVALVKHAVSLL